MQSHPVDAGHLAERSSGRSLAARLSPAHLSLDSWAVALALLAALLVRSGVVKHIPW